MWRGLSRGEVVEMVCEGGLLGRGEADWLAGRQGQVAARNMRGRKQPFNAVPLFWSQHYDTVISYVGHAEQWDRLDVDGDPAAHNFAVSFWQGGKKVAVATVGRDLDSLQAELTFEQEPAT